MGKLTRMSLLINFAILICISINGISGIQLGCRDEQNHIVDWYINYKLPKLSGTSASSGETYAYVTSKDSENWTLSSTRITSNSSMIGQTVNSLLSFKKDISYLFYNDQPPSGYNGTSNGHLKGIVAFDGKSGFWLIYSMPKFCDGNRFEYPENAKMKGQNIICVTFRTAESLNEICTQLLYARPHIYEYSLAKDDEEFLDDNTKTLFTDKPKFIRKSPFWRKVALKSYNRTVFVSFMKNGKLKKDLYSSVVAPGLMSSLATQTWMEGSGTVLPPTCGSNYSVVDIRTIDMQISNHNDDFSYNSGADHSKWAVSTDKKLMPWICIGDMNRMESQEKRGGGSLCVQSLQIGTLYRDLISDAEKCNTNFINRT